MNEQTGLYDYIKALRRYARFIAAITVFGSMCAVGYSLEQETRYAASASLALEDENRALRALGTAAGPASTPEERAAVGAKTVVDPDVLEKVRQQLKLQASAANLRRDIEVTPDATSSLVIIRAEAPEAQAAADLANSIARVATDLQAERQRSELGAATKRLQIRLRSLPVNDPSRVVYASRISEIEAVASIARPVSIAALATVPDSPAAPKPVRNGIVGGTVGLLLAFCLALARSALDRRLRSDEDIRAVFDLPILGRIPDELLGRLALGATESPSSNLDDLEPFRILRANLESLDLDRKIRSIAVTSPLPAEGKSTVAAALASSFAVAGRTTLLLECDLRRPVLAKRLGLPQAPGLVDHLTGRAGFGDVVKTFALRYDDDDGTAAPTRSLACIVAGRIPRNPAELLVSDRFAEFMALVVNEFEIVVVDTSPLLLVADTLEIVPRVDAMLLCARMSQTTREQASAARSALQTLPDVSAVVVTGIKPGDETNEYGYYGRYGSYKYAAGADESHSA